MTILLLLLVLLIHHKCGHESGGTNTIINSAGADISGRGWSTATMTGTTIGTRADTSSTTDTMSSTNSRCKTRTTETGMMTRIL